MNHGHDASSLIAFEERVRDAFLERRIHSPVHLSGGNEDDLLRIFKDVQPQDWVFSTWRSHYHALLKGIQEEEVFEAILAGRSMYLMSEDHRFMTSSIVGGCLPTACGVALGIKRVREETPFDKLGPDRTLGANVWVFIGDMCERTGIFHEFLAYCDGHRLPVKVVVEDNGVSTNTPTEQAWGGGVEYGCSVPVIRYKYKRRWPHVGVGEMVEF